MNAFQPNFESGEREPEAFSPTLTQSPEVEVYEPKFEQIREDLRYMFGINVDNENELSSSLIKKGMHDVALEHLKDGNPFSLDYFVNEKLLTPEDFTDEDLTEMKPYALQLIKNIRNVAILTNTKKLFVDIGILSEDEANISPTVH